MLSAGDLSGTCKTIMLEDNQRVLGIQSRFDGSYNGTHCDIQFMIYNID
jgi:hypothetical protein